jgi:hypothetical protein
MTTRPEERGRRMPAGRDVQSGNGEPRRSGPGRPRQGVAEAAIKSFLRSVAGRLGRAIARAIVGRR